MVTNQVGEDQDLQLADLSTYNKACLGYSSYPIPDSDTRTDYRVPDSLYSEISVDALGPLHTALATVLIDHDLDHISKMPARNTPAASIIYTPNHTAQ